MSRRSCPTILAIALSMVTLALGYLAHRSTGEARLYGWLASRAFGGPESGIAPPALSIATTLHDDLVYVDTSQYGNARHVVADPTGPLLFGYVDADASAPYEAVALARGVATRIVLSYSNDDGASWTDLPQKLGEHPNRPALAYDPVADTLHLAFQARGLETHSDVVYARFAVDRYEDGAIAGLRQEGRLVLERDIGSRPAIVWKPTAGSRGRLVVAWTAWGGDRLGEVRVTTRSLKYTEEDFVASGWQAPGGPRWTESGAGGTRLPPAEVDAAVVDRETEVSQDRFGIACPVVRGGTGPHAGDLYVVYSLHGASSDAWRWRKAIWSGEASSWSEGWEPAQTVARGHFDEGRIEKQLTASCLNDPHTDSIWFTVARHDFRLWPIVGGDVLELYQLDANDEMTREGAVYWVGARSSRHMMSSLTLVPRIAAPGKTVAPDLGILFVTGDASRADGWVRYRQYRHGEGFTRPVDVYAVSSNNYPNASDTVRDGHLVGIFRTNTDPFTLRRFSIRASGDDTGRRW